MQALQAGVRCIAERKTTEDRPHHRAHKSLHLLGRATQEFHLGNHVGGAEAEALGFDGIGCNEHHQNGYGLMPSPNIIAAGLARRTSRAAIAVIGNSIALYNPPIRAAEEFAMLDVISGGRLLAGFPVGTSMDTNYCYGQIPALTRDKYAEAHELIMRAWAEEEPFAFDGKYNQLRWVNCWPKPIQKHRDLGLLPRLRL